MNNMESKRERERERERESKIKSRQIFDGSEVARWWSRIVWRFGKETQI
jgi:hypothetical protein